jgi:hypothetical protein
MGQNPTSTLVDQDENGFKTWKLISYCIHCIQAYAVVENRATLSSKYMRGYTPTPGTTRGLEQ